MKTGLNVSEFFVNLTVYLDTIYLFDDKLSESEKKLSQGLYFKVYLSLQRYVYLSVLKRYTLSFKLNMFSGLKV